MNSILIMRLRLDLFMKYINTHDIPNYQEKLKFCDINPSFEFDGDIYSWFHRMIFSNLEQLKKECLIYKDIYPMAYQKVFNLIEKKEIKLSFSERVKYLMEYCETHSIPSGRSKIRFCDLKNIDDQINIGIWIQGILENQRQKFIEECSLYREIHPNAYQKILKRLERKSLNFEDRVKYFMQFINEHPIPTVTNRITFHEMVPQSSDFVFVVDWFSYQLNSNLDGLTQECLKYRFIYPDAYTKISNRFKCYQKLKNNVFLSFEDRVQLYMKYLNSHENIKSVSSLSFKDMDHTVHDSTIIIDWQTKQLHDNEKLFAEECAKYKEVYPIGYQRIQERITKFKLRRDNYELLFKLRVESFMSYVENHDIPKYHDSLKFCDLSDEVLDTFSVGIWFIHTLSYRLPKFIGEYSKYKEVYPNAYRKISNRINNSNPRLNKERKELICVLTNIRNQLMNEQVLEKKNTRVRTK